MSYQPLYDMGRSLTSLVLGRGRGVNLLQYLFSMEVTLTPERSKRFTGLLVSAAVALLVISGAGGYAAWRTWHHGPTEDLSVQMLREVSDVYLLPTDEQPTIARITDVSKVGDQVFFKDAQDGDVLLVYRQAKLALIYRPEVHKLVNVGPYRETDSQN